MSIYSNDNIRKIAKLTTRELPQKSKNAKITVRENNGLYSTYIVYNRLYICIETIHFPGNFVPFRLNFDEVIKRYVTVSM